MDIIIETSTGTSAYSISKSAILATTLVMLAIYITFYVLRSVGIYKLAKGQGVKKAFFAWIPCLWMFTACKVIGQTRFFGTTAEKVAVWACVIFSLATVVPLVQSFLSNFPYVAYYLQGGSVSLLFKDGIYVSTGDDFINRFDTNAINAIIRTLGVFGVLLRFAEIFITVSVYIALFRKFWPEHYILAAVLSFFGLFGIFVFAIRNKKAVDFNEYIRRRYYGAGFTPYGNRYYGQGGNGYNGSGAPHGESGDKEPFGEFSDKPEEPFGEFDGGGDKKENDDKSDDYFQ